jgi:hypothetical protein
MSFYSKICYSFSIFVLTIFGIAYIPDLIPKKSPQAQPENPTRKAEYINLANLCKNAGVVLDVKRDYNTGETSVRVPQGTYYTATDLKYKHTSRRVEMDYGFVYPAIFDNDKVLSCGQVNLEVLKKRSIPFTQLDSSIYLAEDNIDKRTNQKYTSISVKNAKPSMIYIAFIEGRTPIVVFNNGGGTSIQNYGTLSQVRIASFDAKL